MSGAELAAILPAAMGGTAGGAAASGLTSLLGPSSVTAALAGDAMMPGALAGSVAQLSTPFAATGAVPTVAEGAGLLGKGGLLGQAAKHMGSGMLSDSLEPQQGSAAPPQPPQYDPEAIRKALEAWMGSQSRMMRGW